MAYRSERREAQARETRRRIVEAAREVFLERGYGGATVRAIAAAAGVSVPTVELAYRTKARLLKAAIDVAIAGDDEEVPVLERAGMAAARAEPTAAGFARAVAAILAPAQQRSAGLVLVALEGASADPGLADVAQQLLRQRAATAADVVRTLASKAELREGRADAIDALWALMDPAIYRGLTRDRGWSTERYRDWFARAALDLLVAGSGGEDL
jgi:TetR/AcrR family transcriptional regulator, regulator of autoinduction and epiphytic fitness